MTSARRLKNILGASAGNFVEWFDWFAYASFALYFSRAFFPSGDQTAQLLNTALVFAGGFIARPIGALLFGIYADRAGRRAALSLSVLMMCSGALVIAMTPTDLGIFSPLLLVLARLLQGLAVGGEYGASATYVAEMASTRHRGFWSGFLYVTLIGGQLAAMSLQVALQQLLSEAQLYAWGWRIPFAVGAALAVVVFWIRRGIEETASFTHAEIKRAERGRPLTLLTEYPKETAIVLALTAAGAIGFYTYAVYMLKLLVNTAGFDKTVAAEIMTWVLATLLFFPPLVGWLADHVGHKRTLLVAFAASALLAVPVLNALASASDPLMVYLLCLLPLFFLSGYYALSAIVKAELYPVHVRALGVSLPYAVALAIFGGNAETTALYFKKIGLESGYFWLVATIFACGFAAATLLPDERRGTRLADDNLA
jgi:MHS family alpha-ketoglutarate permease-like MFS transporter